MACWGTLQERGEGTTGETKLDFVGRGREGTSKLRPKDEFTRKKGDGEERTPDRGNNI